MMASVTSSPSVSWRARIVPLALGSALLIAVNLLVYARVVSFDFVRWDDDLNIIANTSLSAPLSWDLVKESFSADQALRFKPVHFWLSWLLYQAFGLAPAGWHAANLFLHVAATLLFFHVLRQVVAMAAPQASQLRVMSVAIGGGALWAVHPLRAEVVAWATASTYPCATLWLLVSFACYLEVDRPGRKRRQWLGLAWLFAVASYASYPIGLTYALFLVIFDRWKQGRAPRPAGDGAVRAMNWAVPAAFLTPAVLAVAFTLWSRFANPGIFIAAPTLSEFGLPWRVLVSLASLGYLAGRFFWPVDLTPNGPPLAITEVFWQLLLLALAALGVLIWAWWRRRAQRDFLWLTGAFAALSLPCLGLVERPMWPVDRYSYLIHLVLIAGLAGWMARRFCTVPRARGAGVAGVALIGLSAFYAARQSEIWRDSSSLFAHMEANARFKEDPLQAAHIYIMWAQHERKAGRPQKSDELFNRAYLTYMDTMRLAVAAHDYRRAVEVSAYMADNFQPTANLRRERGGWLLRLGHHREALAELEAAERALSGDPRTQALREEVQRHLAAAKAGEPAAVSR